MTIQNRNRLFWALVAVAAVGIPIAWARALARPEAAGPRRTIIVTARDMRFNVTNPDIVLGPGEAVRIIFRNEDPGMKHDLVIRDLGLATPVLAAGEEAILEFRAPAEGVFDYLCSLHPVSMRGILRIGEAPRRAQGD